MKAFFGTLFLGSVGTGCADGCAAGCTGAVLVLHDANRLQDGTAGYAIRRTGEKYAPAGAETRAFLPETQQAATRGRQAS